MVHVIHTGDNDKKKQEIISAAQKKFGIYGYGKTTMAEIAEELGISKASLYYYFPDKDSLFRAVFEKEKQEYIDKLYAAIDSSNDVIQLLYQYIDLRNLHFKYFVNLSRVSFEDFKGLKTVLKDLWEVFVQKERDALQVILAKGVSQGVFHIEQLGETADLFLDVVKGITHAYMHNNSMKGMEDSDFALLNKKIKYFITIFIKGISK